MTSTASHASPTSPTSPASHASHAKDEKYQAYLRAKSRVYHAKKHAQENGIPTLNQIANSPWNAMDALSRAFRQVQPTQFVPVDDKEFDAVVYGNAKSGVGSAAGLVKPSAESRKESQFWTRVPWRRIAPFCFVLALIVFQTSYSFEASIANSPMQSVSLLVNGVVAPWFPRTLRDVDVVQTIPKNAVVIDVRTLQLVQPLPNSLHLPLATLPTNLDKLSHARFNAHPVVITCLKGLERDCIQAAILLRDAHFVKVAILDGGIKRWHRDEL